MLRIGLACGLAVGMVSAAVAAPLRVALVDFEDQTGLASDHLLGGAIAPGALAQKGALVLGKRLANSPAFSLIDRRDFTRELEQQDLTDAGVPTSTKPSVLNAAQALRADAVIRGSILSFSTGKEVVNQAGFQAEFSKITMRVALEAQSSIDGEVIAIADGAAHMKLRQTPQLTTVLSEDQVIGLMEQAIDDGLAEVQSAIDTWTAQLDARPRVKITVSTDADPALVEIDGMLVGTTPLTEYEVFKGDHVLVIGKPGYYDMSKRVMFETDTAIEVPMLKVQLSADEAAEVLKTIRLHVFQGEPGFVFRPIITTSD